MTTERAWLRSCAWLVIVALRRIAKHRKPRQARSRGKRFIILGYLSPETCSSDITTEALRPGPLYHGGTETQRKSGDYLLRGVFALQKYSGHSYLLRFFPPCLCVSVVNLAE